ncbi:MAG: hypothetical protein J3R72DRAFT_82038 [Linnemannia gamsii]|nr:MAG: hypothetical protein J3R72DRAFT_82038 [Linnemannia gamsii]
MSTNPSQNPLSTPMRARFLSENSSSSLSRAATYPTENVLANRTHLSCLNSGMSPSDPRPMSEEDSDLAGRMTRSINIKMYESDAKDATSLYVTCLDEDHQKNDFIGNCVVNLATVIDYGEHDDWFELTFKGREAGELQLQLTYYSYVRAFPRGFVGLSFFIFRTQERST